MTGQGYVIRQQDRNAAVAFIDNRISMDPEWLGNVESKRVIAEREYREFKDDPLGFNEWCKKWLNDAQWNQLKEAISFERGLKEKLMRIQPDKTISLTHRAWEILSDLAKQDACTLSEVIVNRLGRDWVSIYVRSESQYNSTPNNRQIHPR